MAVGVLFVLTLSSFISEVPERESRILLGIVTFFIIFPFIGSSTAILFHRTDYLDERSRKVRFNDAKKLTGFGFIFFGLYIAAIIVVPGLLGVIGGEPFLAPTQQEQCVMSPEKFNVSADPWKCSMFSPGSLAEQCAKNPEYYKVTRLDCAELIPP
jgi:hypothetical protein